MPTHSVWLRCSSRTRGCTRHPPASKQSLALLCRPHALQTHAPCSGLAALGYHILTFKRWGDEYPYVLRFVAFFVAMVVELLWENVMVW